MFSKAFHLDQQPRCRNEQDGVDSRILAYGAGLTVMEWIFHHTGYVIPMHAHYHEQVTHVVKGSVRGITADGKDEVFTAGEAMYFGPNEAHSVIILEDDTVVIDSFTPCRMDHLERHSVEMDN